MKLLIVAVLLLASVPLTGAAAPGPAPAPAFSCPSRPALPDSIQDQDFRVWYAPGGRGDAGLLLHTLRQIAGKLSFMPKPFTDTISCNSGGSGHIDFYLVDEVRPSFWDPRSDAASVFILPPATDPASGFVEVAKGGSSVARGCAVAHAYFHLVQARYGFQELRANFWWYEGTADLAEFLYFKHCDFPGQDAELYLDRLSHRSFEALNGYPEAYGTWLWPLYLYRHAGPASVRNVFEKMSRGGTSAVDAIPDSTWARDFPEFSLAEFNKGPVDEFKREGAATGSVTVKEIAASLDGAAVKRLSARALLYPTAVRHYLVDLLDVDTRYVSLDFSDFAGNDAVHIKALQQWTKGPDPAATADDWTDAAASDWTGRKKIYLCRDEEDEDFQQILIAISNVDPDAGTIRGKVKVRSEAFCPWNVNGRLSISGTPGGLVVGAPASGRYTRTTRWDLKPDGPPTVCPAVSRACLPLVGTMRDSVQWNVQATFALEGRTLTMGATGTQDYEYVKEPQAADIVRPALFQQMVWDREAEKFRPVISIMLANSRRISAERSVHMTPAHTAHYEYGANPGGCALFQANNVHGLVNYSQDTDGECGYEDFGQYGAAGPLYFSPFEVEPDLKRTSDNKPGDQFCPEANLARPWDPLSGGPCAHVEFDPHAIEGDVHVLNYRDTIGGQPEGAFSIDHAREGECASGSSDPCPVAAENFDIAGNAWPLSIRLSVVLRRAPDPDR